ncbi:MAG: protein kinase [Pirellulales bacterium]
MHPATTHWLPLEHSSADAVSCGSACGGELTRCDRLAGATQHTAAVAAPGRKGEHIPDSVGKYEVRRLLGRGGQATALLAWDPDLQREVVLKLYHSAKTPAERAAVLREGQALVQVHSPYVAQCFAAERHEDVPYLVMEYIDGESLSQRVSDRPLTLDESLRLVEQLARGLEAVHASGLLHRDVKPSNILLSPQGEPKLIDFGLAAEVGSEQLRQISGTPAYMAPEQACGDVERLDARTDLFGLGAVFYELLTGRPPYLGENATIIWRLAREGRVTPAAARATGLRTDVNEVCMRCLAREPQGRFGSARELASAVEVLLHGKRRAWNWTIGWGKLRFRVAFGVSVLASVVAALLLGPELATRAPHGVAWHATTMGPTEQSHQVQAWATDLKPDLGAPDLPGPAYAGPGMAGPGMTGAARTGAARTGAAMASAGGTDSADASARIEDAPESLRFRLENRSGDAAEQAPRWVGEGVELLVEGELSGLELAMGRLPAVAEQRDLGGAQSYYLELAAPRSLEIWEDRQDGAFVANVWGWTWAEAALPGGRQHYWLAVEPATGGYWIWPGESTAPEKQAGGSESCRLRIRNLAERP